ncbi:MAG: cyclic nucleotide-binding domain-containing protein [Spirochaetaceae bacterium]|jgi:anti-sigma regulatory factor (Ser/Thr protein kinase)|nr:cyclic nucleotide-binding domain-containing protein [Spirochaetaceae bacterium]
MAILGIINADPDIKAAIEAAFAGKKDYDLKFLSKKENIVEFLNYELPEIIVINFSDLRLSIEKAITHIKNDKWLSNNFGVVGIFSGDRDQEEDLLAKYRAINVLSLLEKSRIRSHLVKSIDIIRENYQIIFQREFTRELVCGATGSFVLENDILAVPLYAGIGATILSQRGCINPEKKMHLQLALDELLINAIEHGNCSISYDEKTEAMENGKSVVDLVMERCKKPGVRAKRVDFQWEIKNDQTIFTIRDQGEGFNVQANLKKIREQDMTSTHGRGIRLAAMFSNQLKYNKKGNQVKLIINHDTTVEPDVPAGFSGEQVVSVKKGDIVLRENEPSDYLYYIASGRYSVIHKRKQVGSLGPQDIFMGEMSFLLNQKRSAKVKAESAGRLILLTRKTFIDVIRKYPHYGIFLSKLLAKRLVRSNDQNADLARQIKGT